MTETVVCDECCAVVPAESLMSHVVWHEWLTRQLAKLITGGAP